MYEQTAEGVSRLPEYVSGSHCSCVNTAAATACSARLLLASAAARFLVFILNQL